MDVFWGCPERDVAQSALQDEQAKIAKGVNRRHKRTWEGWLRSDIRPFLFSQMDSAEVNLIGAWKHDVFFFLFWKRMCFPVCASLLCMNGRKSFIFWCVFFSIGCSLFFFVFIT